MSSPHAIPIEGDCLSMDQMTSYLSYRLSPDEEAKTDRHLAHCNLCCGALEKLAERMGDGDIPLETIQQREADFKHALEHMNHHTNRPVVQAKKQLWWKAAAILLVLIIPAYFISTFMLSADHMDLYAAHFEPYADVLTVRSASTGVSPPLNNAMLLYNQKKYAQAAEAFNRVQAPEAGTDLVRLYAGIAHMQSNMFETAKVNFDALAHQSGPLQYAAQWYLALLQLRSDQLSHAITTLEAIPSSDEHYHQKAQSLLDQINADLL